MEKIAVSGSFDNIRSQEMRFLEEASRFGPLHVLLWSDDVVEKISGQPPKFPLAERKYFLEAVKYVYKVRIINEVASPEMLPSVKDFVPRMWAVMEPQDTLEKRAFCIENEIVYTVIEDSDLKGYPVYQTQADGTPRNKKVVVTGCFDWFHSGHVRFFEETSEFGDLYVVVGHDENVRLLKGDEHPMYNEDERCYMVGSIKFVKQALVSSGSGWMDAEPEINVLQPDFYAVNEDGDKPEKHEFCQRYGIKYLVLSRDPAPGLQKRSSTDLRGF